VVDRPLKLIIVHAPSSSPGADPDLHVVRFASVARARRPLVTPTVPRRGSARAALIVAFALGLCVAFGLFFHGGCQDKPHLRDPQPTLDAIGDTNAAVADRLPRRADTIDTHADGIATAVPPKVEVRIRPHVSGIRTETAGLRADAEQLRGAVQQVEEAKVDLQAIQDTLRKRDERIAKLEQEKKNGERALMGGLIVLGVIGLGVSATFVAMGNKRGIATGIGAGVILIVALMVGFYSLWLAIMFAAVAAVAIIIGVILVVQRLRRERKATKELVATVEAAKQALPAPVRMDLFGQGAIPGKVDVLQSPTTQAMVREARDSDDVRLAAPAAA
jgi:hypothetical protein